MADELILKYLRENASSSQDDLVDQLRKAGYAEADIEAAVAEMDVHNKKQAVKTESGKTGAPVDTSGAGKTILCLEDDDAIRRSLAWRLKQLSFDVIEVVDGEAGVKVAVEKKPDLITLDLILPKLNGFEVLKKLRAPGGLPNTPIIVYSSLTGTQDRDEIISAGATDFVLKTEDSLDEVIASIKKYV